MDFARPATWLGLFDDHPHPRHLPQVDDSDVDFLPLSFLAIFICRTDLKSPMKSQNSPTELFHVNEHNMWLLGHYFHHLESDRWPSLDPSGQKRQAQALFNVLEKSFYALDDQLNADATNKETI